MIKSFPEFSELDIGHRDEIRDICSETDPYADFNFINLFCWSDGKGKVSILNGNLVVQLPDYTSDKTVVSLLGGHAIDESLQELLTISNRLKLVPEAVVSRIENPDRFIIAEDIGDHDYVYNVADVSNLSGGKFKSKRHKLNGVKSALADTVEVATKVDISEEDKQDMRDLFIAWVENYREHNLEKDAEYRAFNTLLDNLPYLEVAFTTIRDRGRMVAFSVNEVIDSEYALCHFEKVIRLHPHIGVLIVNEAAKYLSEVGCTYMNWEQDLGVPGLRKAKRSYHPDKLLRKYSVALSERATSEE